MLTVIEVMDKNELVVTVDGELRFIKDVYVHHGEFYDKTSYVMDYDGDIFLQEDIEDTHFLYEDEWYNCEYWTTCDACGSLVSKDDAIWDDGWYCDDCYFYCVECDEYYANEHRESYELSNGDMICDNCSRDHYVRCDTCNELVHMDYSYYADGVEVDMCEGCYNYYTSQCEECGEVFYTDDMEDGYCRSCNRDRSYDYEDRGFSVLSYSYKPKPVFYGEHANGKGIGFELEVCTNGDYQKYVFGNRLVELCGNALYYKDDGSLNSGGFEIISHPHTHKELINNFPWEEICKSAIENGYISHDYDGGAGFHLHFSRDYFGKSRIEQEFNISKMLMFYNLYFEELFKASRRTRAQLHWCDKMFANSKTNKTLERLCKTRARDGNSHNGRYVTINLENSHTVEFRLGRGSLVPSSIRSWIDLHYRLVMNVKNARMGVHFADDMLSGIRQETVEYLKKRKAFLPQVDTLKVSNDNEALAASPNN